MRRLWAVVLTVCLGLPLVGAAPSAFSSKPNVVVYPFQANGSTVDREAGSRLATIIATQMANTGQIVVVAPPPGTERKDYLTVAQANGAEYYISGYISPLGDAVSVVEQVVSVASGIVIYSTTAQLHTYADAAGQGDDLAAFIARHANRGLAAIGTPPPAASPTPAASSGPEANLGKLFGRRKKAAPASPKPAAAPAATAPAAALSNMTAPPKSAPRAQPATAASAAATPAAGHAAGNADAYAILPVEGSADAAVRGVAGERLAQRAHGVRVESLAAACAGHAPRAVLASALAVRPDLQFGGSSASYELSAVDCNGKVAWKRSFSADAGGAQSAQLAAERVVDAAIGAYLNPPRRRR